VTLAPLDGFVIAVTADRRADEQAELLRRRGASVALTPTIATDYLASDDDVRTATLVAIEASPEYVVLLTGIGLRAWIEAAQSWDLDGRLMAMLRSAKVLARGPKAAAAVTAAGVSVWRSAETEQADELVDVLRGEVRPGERVVLQRHGGEERRFARGLSDRGVEVVEVPVYRWRLPAGDAAIQALVDDVAERRVHAVTFTSAPAVQNLFAVAEHADAATTLRHAFSGDVVAACVGPVCAAVARGLGIAEPAFPETGRLGLMIRSLTSRLAETRVAGALAGVEVELQGRAMRVGGERVELTPREEEVLRNLLTAKGAVTPAPEPVVRRLRRKLGPAGSGVETVRRRGYRLALA
jgi:uroporphyrinogen-III synthase